MLLSLSYVLNISFYVLFMVNEMLGNGSNPRCFFFVLTVLVYIWCLQKLHAMDDTLHV